MHHRAVCGYQMNSTFLLAASSEAFNLCWLLYCISDVIWRGDTSSCSKAPVSGFSRCACCSGQAVPWQHWKRPLQRLSDGCTKPLEGVEALDSVSDLLLLRIFRLCVSIFEWRWLLGPLNVPMEQWLIETSQTLCWAWGVGERKINSPLSSLFGLFIKMRFTKTITFLGTDRALSVRWDLPPVVGK